MSTQQSNLNEDMERFDHLGYTTQHSSYAAMFRLYQHGYNCQREEAEYESNAAQILDRVQRADNASEKHVEIRGEFVYVTAYGIFGLTTPAYHELIACLEQIADYPILDEADVRMRISEMAENDADWHMDDARTIIEGGQAAFEADVDASTYGGDWSDYADEPPEEAAKMLAYRLAFAAIEEG